jgi:hypothetical protein
MVVREQATGERIFCDYLFGGVDNLPSDEFLLLKISGGVANIDIEFTYFLT